MSKKFKAVAAITCTLFLAVGMSGCKIGAVFCFMGEPCTTSQS